MKNYLLPVLVLFISVVNSIAQPVYIKLDIEGSALKKVSKQFDKGDRFKTIVLKEIIDYEAGLEQKRNVVSLIKESGDAVETEYSKKFQDDLSFTTTPKTFWLAKAIQSRVYNNIIENGFQYDVRNDLEEESLDYLNFLTSNDAFLEDPAIKDYLQSIFLKIYQYPLNDGRLGQLDIRILKTNEPYAGILPNGTALISIGILNLANSDDEVTAILAHETAHFVLDHAVQNINAQIKREKRAEFWAGLATVAIAATSTYAAVKKDIYIDPSVVASSAILAYSIASQINERVGLKYSQNQEKEADQSAGELLEMLGYNKDALGSVLAKLRDYYYYTGNYKVFSGNGTHPNITYRIEQLGTPQTSYNDREFDKRISALLTTGAYYEYSKSHFQTCEKLLQRNINSGSATEEDYILMALNNLAQYNSESKYAESLSLLEKAKHLGVNPDNQVFKVEALIHLRKNDNLAAKNSLAKYQTEVETQLKGIDHTLLASASWNELNNRLNDELIWTKKMLFKLNN